MEVIREYKEHRIEKHASIASECITCTSHNQPCKIVERLEKKVKDIGGKEVDSVSKTATSKKQLNTTTQKSDELKSKLSSLENQVTKIEKK